jgi:hypothetical protein
LIPLDSLPLGVTVDLEPYLTAGRRAHFERWAVGLPVPWQADPSKRYVVFYHDARRWALAWNRAVATSRAMEDT